MLAPRHLKVRIVAVAGAIGLAATAAGCSVPHNERAAAAPTKPTSVRTYALTGLPAPTDSKPRPVITIKVDNTEAGRPQRGVANADLIIEEPVEGGLTRLAAFYESKLPESVGPVRSARISDIGLVKPVAATVVASGAAQPTITAFKAADVPLIDESHPAFTRDPSRAAPNNLFVNPTLLDRKDAGRLPAQSYFEFGKSKLGPGAEANRVTVRYTYSVTEDWEYLAGKRVWQRTGGDAPYPVDTLLLLTVRLRDAGYRDAAGSMVPIVESSGKGAGYLLSGGEVHRIAWTKASEKKPFEIMTTEGLVTPVPPGRTWLGLLPRGQGKLTYS